MSRSRHRLKAATLLESVLAIGLMAAALAFGTAMYGRVLGADHAMERLRAWALTEEILTARSQALPDQPWDTHRFNVSLSETPIGQGLVLVTIRCARGDRELLQRSTIQPLRP